MRKHVAHDPSSLSKRYLKQKTQPNLNSLAVHDILSSTHRPRLLVPRHCRNLGQQHHVSLSRRREGTQCTASSSSTPAVTLFPAGKKQARVKLPACFIKVSVQEALAPEVGQQIDDAVSGGVTGVWLVDDENAGGAGLYDAAVALKGILRGRATLLVEDRTDIATAAEADGVILSPSGVPVVVAKRMLGEASLVARRVSNPADARAAAAEGASLVLLQDEGGACPSAQAVEEAKEGQTSSSSIPLLVYISEGEAAGRAADATAASDGLALPLRGLAQAAASCSGVEHESPAQQVAALASLLARGNGTTLAFAPSPAAPVRERDGTGDGRHLLDDVREELLERERSLLSDILALLQDVTPQMAEIELLVDALRGLDELFLVVVVGEFNSGKSTVINALLGGKFLADGILPTTNEISVIKFSANGSEEVKQEGDGQFVRYLPAPLLRELNIVDTPGTNVILQRQQRLTEEYVPRADLVLFTMSADRPFTESEVQFLRYIRQWGKKVVFLVNKLDILAGEDEVAEVQRFVADNARAVLGVDSARVLPIAARSALAAKLDLLGSRGEYADLTTGDQVLVNDPRWARSQFGVLEHFMRDFLAGGAGGSESMRLKLQTPLYVAAALLDAARKQLEADLALAQQEEAAVRLVGQQLEDFRKAMEVDSAAQRSEGRRLVRAAVKRAQALVDETLQLSNLDVLGNYLLGSKGGEKRLPVARGFEAEVVGDTSEKLRRLVADHATWLRSNCERQLDNYRAFADARAEQLGRSLSALPASASQEASEGSETLAAARREWRVTHNLSATPSPPGEASQSGEAGAEAGGETAVAIVARFEPRAAALVLEEEIREAVIGTAGAAVGAGLLGVGLTVVLPTTLEDLLAVALAGLVGYVALLNLPLRRGEAKAKLEKVASNFIKEVEKKLEAELAEGLSSTEGQVRAWMEPLAQLTAAQVRRAEDGEARRARLAERLEDLQERALRIG